MYFKFSKKVIITTAILIIVLSNVAFMGMAPVDIVLSNEEFSYKAETGDVAAQLIATDSDVGDVHTFEIISGAYWFYIEGNKLLVVDKSRIMANVRYPVGVRVIDSEGLSYEKTVYPTCRNLRPIAEPVSIELDENTEKTGFFVATEPESEPITFVIQTNPSKGSVQLLDATTGEFKYTPYANIVGTDSFTYYATDGATWSDFTTVSINILNVNSIPVCSDIDLAVTEDNDLNGQLIGNDSDGDLLTYEIVSEPTNGTLSAFNRMTGTFKYSPNADYNGSDSFTYKANDGTEDSIVKTVTLNISSINDPPAANDGTLTTNENASKNGTLSGSDVDGDTISYSIVSQGTKGTVSLTDASTGAYTYTPNPNVFGTDSFTFKVNDGIMDSNIGTIVVTVNSTNIAPVANAGALEVTEDTPAIGTMTGTDVDGDALSYSIVSQGIKGTVVVNDASTGGYTYTPNPNANGVDSFSFKVNDGVEDSPVAMINVVITEVNDRPVANNKTVTTNLAAAASGNLSGTDIDGDSLTYIIEDQATKGVVLITDASTGAFTYTPNPSVTGIDSFTFKVNDGSLDSAVATVDVTILSTNEYNLSELILTPGNLTPAFADNHQDYSVELAYEDSMLTVKCNPLNPKKVNINGEIITVDYKGDYEKTINLNVGVNTISIGVLDDYENLVKEYVIIVTRANRRGGNSNNNTSGQTQQEMKNLEEQGASVLVNNQTISVGEVSTEVVDNQVFTRVTLDEKLIDSYLVNANADKIVRMVAVNDSAKVTGELNGQMVKDMEIKDTVIKVETDFAMITIPAEQIKIDDVLQKMGPLLSLEDIKVEIEVSKTAQKTAQLMQSISTEQGIELVSDPVDFKVRCSYGGKTVEVDMFNQFTKRTLPLPENIDSNRITTAVTLEKNGALRHIPTKVTQVDGKYYAEINSLTNSTYSLVWNPVSYDDVENHWSKDEVNDMGSRMIQLDTTNNDFNPDQAITRAESAVLLIKALGLKPSAITGNFNDVDENHVYYGYIKAAYDFGLINGSTEYYYMPDEQLSREQAMCIIANAMKMTNLNISIDLNNFSALDGFGDANEVSGWARSGVSACMEAKIAHGTSDNMLAPADYVTRAELTVMIRRLLRQSDLI